MAKRADVRKLVLLDTDVSRLVQLLKDKASENNQYCAALKDEISKANIVTRPELPESAITMHSTVELLDLEDKERTKYTLVFPWEADVDSNKISILAPIGTAMIGYRQGDQISWMVPGGLRKLKVTNVAQPPIT